MKKIYRVMVGVRTFRICDSKDEAMFYAKLLFECEYQYNNVWIAHKNGNQVKGTPILKKGE